MGTAAEPRPAELPLRGGKDGATVRLHPLLCARMVAPPAFLERVDGRMSRLKALGVRVPRDEWIQIPVIAFLVEHPTAGPVLVDTGFHPAVAVDPKQALGSLGGLVFKEVEMDANQAVAAQLRDRGVDPASVSTVLMTHLHSDHASGIAEFPAATFLVSAKEWEAGSSGRQTDGYLRRQYDHAFDYRTLDFDAADADSFATFGRSFDIFGDGSIRMVFTPGHSPGHCSVILRLRGREALIAGDAAYTVRTIRESHLPFKMDDEHRFRRSLREIQLYLKGTPDALVIPGHDMEAWRRLDSVYE
ncbi:MAG TPA: N-acyl homoserine lactonase family protein [Thermoleophilaceae bacterium]|nr:N-acyl homoserine lactonase family protein [Thermoleophilaceae bacterium]